ncbi:MAG: DNA primase [Lachnospiraceae bacterium]|nr:DNA primase [Lachnospiraceae bacterium]
MYYPDEIIEDVRAKNDIVSVIGQYITLKKKSGSNYFALCPFHGEKTPSFSVNESRQMYHCFGCGESGNVITFVMKYENMSFPEAVKLLADRVGISLPQKELTEEQKKAQTEKTRIRALLKEAATIYYQILRSEEGKIGLEYFRKRKLNDETLRRFGLGFAGKKPIWKALKNKGYTDDELVKSGIVRVDEKYGMSDRMWNRVIFPIMDINNKVIGFGGRVLGDGEPKYLNSPETVVFNKRANLYGLNYAKKSGKKYMIACEGYMDVISMHQAGFTEAVASLGTAFTDEQGRLLRRYTDEIRLTYDSDEAGVKAALRAIPILKNCGIHSKIIHLEPYKDPDEFIKNLGVEEFQKRIDEAENSFSFEMSKLEQKYNMSDPDERTAFQLEMSKALASISNELERNNHIASMAAKYMIDQNALKNQVEVEKVKGSGMKEPVRIIKAPKDRGADNKVNSGITEAEGMLLTMLVDDPELLESVKQYLKPSDFTEGLSQNVAGMLYEAIENGKSVASILNSFPEVDDQREVSAIINGEVPQLDSNEDKEKALTDLVVKILSNSKKHQFDTMTDGDPIARNVAFKKAMDELKRIRISLKAVSRREE